MKVEGVVLDTNVLISAALSSRGNHFACLSWVLDNAALIASKPLLDELAIRLARPKFKRYLDDARRRSDAELCAGRIARAHQDLSRSR
jgi:putative PIN family toxin of toxin-antitoxin system